MACEGIVARDMDDTRSERSQRRGRGVVQTRAHPHGLRLSQSTSEGERFGRGLANLAAHVIDEDEDGCHAGLLGCLT